MMRSLRLFAFMLFLIALASPAAMARTVSIVAGPDLAGASAAWG